MGFKGCIPGETFPNNLTDFYNSIEKIDFLLSSRSSQGLLLLSAAMVSLPRPLHRRTFRRNHFDRLFCSTIHISSFRSNSRFCVGPLHLRLEQGNDVFHDDTKMDVFVTFSWRFRDVFWRFLCFSNVLVTWVTF